MALDCSGDQRATAVAGRGEEVTPGSRPDLPSDPPWAPPCRAEWVSVADRWYFQLDGKIFTSRATVAAGTATKQQTDEGVGLKRKSPSSRAHVQRDPLPGLHLGRGLIPPQNPTTGVGTIFCPGGSGNHIVTSITLT